LSREPIKDGKGRKWAVRAIVACTAQTQFTPAVQRRRLDNCTPHCPHFVPVAKWNCNARVAGGALQLCDKVRRLLGRATSTLSYNGHHAMNIICVHSEWLAINFNLAGRRYYTRSLAPAETFNVGRSLSHAVAHAVASTKYTRTNMEESRNNNAFSALCARSTLCLLNETHRIPKLMFVDWFAVNLSKIHCLLQCKFNSGVKAFLFA